MAQGSVLGLQGKSLCKAGQVQIQVGPGYETRPRDGLRTGPTGMCVRASKREGKPK